MSLGRQLYNLQEIDLDLEIKAEMLRRLERELSDDSKMKEVKAELDRKREHLVKLQKQQRTMEWAIEDSQAKSNLIREKLYSGVVKNPKELLSLQQQEERLKAQIREAEDRVLEIMGEVEIAQKEIALSIAEVKRLEEGWQGKQEQLLVEQARLKQALELGQQKRSELLAIIEPATLELYQALRIKKQGRAVAKVEQGRCQGCRITLPMSEIQRAWIGEELVQCSSCGRILYLS